MNNMPLSHLLAFLATAVVLVLIACVTAVEITQMVTGYRP